MVRSAGLWRFNQAAVRVHVCGRVPTCAVKRFVGVSAGSAGVDVDDNVVISAC